ncbi:MAG: carbohydrate binding family 9 domain-containing protein [Bacteroidales bacterium]|nr:carbohydrate binding family 9 domain-containing protein [Bacteroidales bacterium]
MKKRNNLNIFLILLMLGLTTRIVNSQPPKPASDLKNALVIERLDLPVTFDGIPDEEAWEKIQPISFTMHSPVYGKDPSEKTDTRIAYDDKYLYFSSRLFFEDPSDLRSASLKRDYMGMGGDWFGIILDTYNDKENGLAFFTSPDGLRWDATILKDAVVGMPDQLPMNISWNTFWDVRTNKDNNGWTLEIRIPFSSLRFQETNGEVRMGLIVQRWIPAKNETDLFPAIPPDWGQTSAMKPSQAQEVVLRGVKSAKPIYIAPYLLTGLQKTNEINIAGTEYLKSTKPALEAGLDVKYGITNNLTMDLTVNTDFAQVESDDQQTNLTRFSLYLPEKRTFFLERSSVFDFALGGNSNLFYSRRIGLSDDGDPIRIYGGARMTGRVGKWDLGVLDMQTASLKLKNEAGIYEDILPSENFGVLRFRRQVINENTYIGAMMTSRLGADGTYNLGYGLDGIFRLFGNDYLDLKWSQTFENDVKNASFSDPSRIMARWERRSSKGLGYNIGYSQSGLHYNPGIGFEMMNDFASVRGGIKWGWLPEEKAKLYSHSPEYRILYMTYIDDRSLMSMTHTLGWTFQTKNQWEGSANFMHNTEVVRDSLELLEDELSILPGTYNFLSFEGRLTTPMTQPFFIMTTIMGGQFYGGTRLSVNMQPTWNISRHFELGAIYNFDKLDFSGRDLHITNHILGIKTMYMLDTRFSLSAYIQYNTALKGVLTNLRIRYNPKEGNDFFLVFNEGRNTNLTREIPTLPLYSARSLLLKYTYTFSL